MATDAIEAVQTYLDLMEARDLEAAQACLARGAKIIFPGNFRAKDTATIAAYGKARYAAVRKTYRSREAFAGPDGTERVVMIGTLAGTTLHDTKFEGIRFVDIFALKNGKIIRQEVWNDLAETGVLDT